MAKAPLSQTLILTEDGSPVSMTAALAVSIPPLVVPTPAPTPTPTPVEVIDKNFPAVPVTTLAINQDGLENEYSARPSGEDYSYNLDRGFPIIRLPFSWGKMQPALFGPLDNTYTQLIIDSIREGGLRGLRFLPDNHSYGIRGTPAEAAAAAADLWDRFVRACIAADVTKYVWGWDLWNEPSEGGFTEDPSLWPKIAMAIARAIQAVDPGRKMVVGANAYSGTWNWIARNPGLGAAIRQLRREGIQAIPGGHLYHDYDASGRFFGYDEQAAKPGEAPVGANTGPTIGVTRLSTFWQGLQNEGLTPIDGITAVVGEVGIPGNDPRWLAAGQNSLDYALSKGMIPFLWSDGPAWSTNYPQLLHRDSDGLQSPILAIVTPRTGAPEPTLFRLEGPTRAVKATAGASYKLTYRGNLAAPRAFMVKATDSDGIVIDLPTVTMPAGQNPTATLAVTFAKASVYVIEATAVGLTPARDPITTSSVVDSFVGASTPDVVISSTHLSWSPSARKGVRLRRLSDNAEADFGYVRSTRLLDSAAILAWANGAELRLVRALDMIPGAQDMQPMYLGDTKRAPSTEDYPQFVVTGPYTAPLIRFGAKSRMNLPLDMNGATEQTIVLRMNWKSGDRVLSWTPFSGGAEDVALAGKWDTPGNSLAMGLIANEWHTYMLRWRANHPQGKQVLRDGVVISTASTEGAASLALGNGSNDMCVGFFRYYDNPSAQFDLTDMVLSHAWSDDALALKLHDEYLAAEQAYADLVPFSVTLSADVKKPEGNSGPTYYSFSVTRPKAGPAVNVPYTFSPGTTSADDYVSGALPGSGIFGIAEGATTSAPLQIAIAGDTIVEADENFGISIDAPAGYLPGARMSATGTILNEDYPAAEVVGAMPFIGVNLVGPEYDNIIWPTDEHVRYYVQRGANIIRLPVRLQRMVPDGTTGVMDSTHATQIDRIIATARQYQIPNAPVMLLIDDHRYKDGSEVADYDRWAVVAARYKDDPYVGYELMNEPGNNDYSYVTPFWIERAKRIFAAGVKGPVIFPLSTGDLPGAFPDPDTGNNSRRSPRILVNAIKSNFADKLAQCKLTFHRYTGGGTYKDANAPDSADSAESATVAAHWMGRTAAWIDAQGLGWLWGEISVPAGTAAEYAQPGFDEATGDTVSMWNMDNLLSAIMGQRLKNAWAVTFWGGGPVGSYHPTRNPGAERWGLNPINGVEQPQMKHVFSKYAPNGEKYGRETQAVSENTVFMPGTYVDNDSHWGKGVRGLNIQFGFKQDAPRSMAYSYVFTMSELAKGSRAIGDGVSGAIMGGAGIDIRVDAGDGNLIFGYWKANFAFENLKIPLHSFTDDIGVFALVVDETSGRLYRDGVLVATGAPLISQGQYGLLNLGNKDGRTVGCPVIFHEVQVWDRALSATEVAAIAPATGKERGLSGYLPFDGDPHTRIGIRGGLKSRYMTVKGYADQPVVGAAPASSPQPAVGRSLAVPGTANQKASAPRSGSAVITDGFAMIDATLFLTAAPSANAALFGNAVKGGASAGGGFVIYIDSKPSSFLVLKPSGSGSVAYPATTKKLPVGKLFILRTVINTKSTAVTIGDTAYAAKTMYQSISIDGGRSWSFHAKAAANVVLGAGETDWLIAPANDDGILKGSVVSLVVTNGAGEVILNPDFSAQLVGTASFADAKGNAWTVTAPAAIANPV